MSPVQKVIGGRMSMAYIEVPQGRVSERFIRLQEVAVPKAVISPGEPEVPNPLVFERKNAGPPIRDVRS